MKNLTGIFLCFLLLNCDNSSKSTGAQQKEEVAESSNAELRKRSPQKIEKTSQIPEGRCDIDIVLLTDQNIDNLTDKEIRDFLFTFSEYCKNNIEYGEYSNEVLFKVVVNYHDVVSEVLKEDSIINEIVFYELSNPVAEMESVDRIIESIDNLEINRKKKSEIIEGFKKSIGYEN